MEQENSSVSSSVNSERKHSYRQLLSRIEEIRENEDIGVQVIEDVGSIIKELNSLEIDCTIENRVDQTDETLLDCLVLSSASGILVKCLEAVDVSKATYDSSEFSSKIIQEVKGDEEDDFRPTDLLKLLEDARNLIPNVPKYHFLYGTCDLSKLPEPKKKKTPVKRSKETAQKKEPEKVNSVTQEEERIDEIVKTFFNVLLDEYTNNGQNPILYYDYVVDTSDYANTVENMFYCSFLIRDGKARISLDSNGNPIIVPMQRKVLKGFRQQGGTNSQVLSSITINDWEKFKKEGLIQKYKKQHSS